MGVSELKVAPCALLKETLLGIAEFPVERLSMASCIVSLGPLIASGATTEIRKTLWVQGCNVPSDFISAFHNAPIMRTLQCLNVGGNKLSTQDIRTISEMQLLDLGMAKCIFDKNALKQLGHSDSVAKQSLLWTSTFARLARAISKELRCSS